MVPTPCLRRPHALQLEDHNQTEYLETLSPTLIRLYTWTEVMLEQVMTIEPQSARPPCDLISKTPASTKLPISRLHGRNPLAETRGTGFSLYSESYRVCWAVWEEQLAIFCPSTIHILSDA